MIDRIFMRWPLVPPAAAYMTGIFLERHTGAPVHMLFAATLLCLCAAAIPKLRRVWLILACVALGALMYALRYEIRSEADLRVIVPEKEVLASIRGELLETPAVRVIHYGEKEYARSSAKVRVSAIQLESHWQAAEGVVMTYTRASLGTKFFPGQMVEIDGVLRVPDAAQAEGLFDYRDYLYNQRIFYQLQAENSADWQLLEGSPARPPVTERFRRWAKEQLAWGVPRRDEALELIWAMTLGWKTALSGEMAEPFMKTGTLHIFAVSGLHVACIAWLLLMLTSRGLGMPRHWAGLVVLPLLWFYTIVTGWQSSAIRSALMATVLIVGWSLKRPTNVLNCTAAAALIILLFHEPEQLFQTGFQLSFAVVASMAIALPRMDEFRKLVPWHDRFLPRQLRAGWIQSLDHPVKWASGSMAVSLAAWAGSLPVVAYYFNLTTPVTLLANLVAVPLSSIALCASMFSLFLPFQPISNVVGWAFMHLTMEVTSWFQYFPLGYFYVTKPNWAFFLLYYSLLVAIATKVLWLESTRRWAISAVSGLAALWLAVSLSARPAAQITFLPAAGTPIYIDMPGKSEDLLVDCSNERDAEYTVIRWLRSRGIGSLRNLLLTHGDINHVGGFFRMHTEFLPARIFTSSARSRSPTYRKVQEALEPLGERAVAITQGSSVGGWRILHPARAHHFSRADDNSTVLYREIAGLKVLILGDLGTLGQRMLMEHEPRLRADLVLTGLPENGEPLLDELVQQLAPKAILVGTTRFPASARGPKALRARLKQTGANIFFLDEEGAVTLTWKQGHCLIESATGSRVEIRP